MLGRLSKIEPANLWIAAGECVRFYVELLSTFVDTFIECQCPSFEWIGHTQRNRQERMTWVLCKNGWVILSGCRRRCPWSFVTKPLMYVFVVPLWPDLFLRYASGLVPCHLSPSLSSLMQAYDVFVLMMGVYLCTFNHTGRSTGRVWRNGITWNRCNQNR